MQNKHITLTPPFGMLPSATSEAATSSSDIKSAVPKKTLDATDSTKAITLEDNAAVSIGTTTVAVTSAMARLEDGTAGKVTSASAASSSAAVTAATDIQTKCPRKTMLHLHSQGPGDLRLQQPLPWHVQIPKLEQ